MGSTLLVRMVGGRDGVLGGLLLTAEDKNAPDGGLEAWLVIVGNWCASFCSFGWINSKCHAVCFCGVD